jgi:hypothetical protein
MVKLEQVQRLWLIRKLYGSGTLNGKGGILPPNDPRLAGLTDEQIELDLMLYMEDHPELKKGAESYKDTEYEQAMREDLGPDPSYLPQGGGPVGPSVGAEDWIDEPID